jgi:hypothetical protein
MVSLCVMQVKAAIDLGKLFLDDVDCMPKFADIIKVLGVARPDLPVGDNSKKASLGRVVVEDFGWVPVANLFNIHVRAQ